MKHPLHLLIQYLLSIYHVPGSVPMLGCSGKQMRSCPCLHGIYTPTAEIKAFIISKLVTV